MRIAKKWLALLLSFTLVFGVLSIGIAVSAKLPSQSDLPIDYELYDYYKDINEAMANSTSVSSDSPWSVGMYINGEWKNADTFKRPAKKDYILATNSAKNQDSIPGFSYNYPKNYSNGPLYNSMLSPSNVEGDSTSNINAAYIFTAPFNGTYTLDKANQELIFSSETANYFAQTKETASLPDLDFGVKITVNDTTVWPKGTESYYSDGWAVFGNKDASVDKIEVPTISDIELSRGDKVMVVAKALTPVAAASVKAQKITGTVKMSLTALGNNEDSNIELKSRYEIYDYFKDAYRAYENETAVESSSPWSVQTYFNEKWNEPDKFSFDESTNYMYVGCNDRSEWGIAYPGYAFYWQPSLTRNELCYVAPVNSGSNPDYVGNTAYVFKAPEKGAYTFDVSNQDTCVAFSDTNFFSPQRMEYSGITFGVRITINDEVIWPDNSYSNPVKDTFAQFGTELKGIPQKIAVPKIEELGMMKGDILRVEYTSFTPISGDPWNQFVKGGVSMTKTSDAVIVDKEAPVFGNGKITLKEAGEDYLQFMWPEATDNLSASDKLKYSLYISKSPFTDGVIPSGASHSVDSTGGLVLRLESDTAYYTAVVVSDAQRNKAVIVGGPFSTKPSSESKEGIYEVYDYLDEITDMAVTDNQSVTIEETVSPWVAQVFDSKWINLNRATRLGDLIYCNMTAPEWGGYYPGMSFYAPQKATLNRYLARLNPAKASSKAYVGNRFDYMAAYTFTAPYAGKYTFEKGNSNYAMNSDFDGYFAVADSGSKNYSLGVRITLNDEVIWPLENTECNLQDGWAVIINAGSETSRVEIPTISDMSLISGDVLRVETKAFDATDDSPWYQQISACVRMVMTEKTIDSEPPVFGSGAIQSTAATTTSLTLTWPLAEDKLSNADSIKYTMYYALKPINAETDLSALEAINLKGNTQRLTLLTQDTDYYIAVMATDISGNSSKIFGGPFRTAKKSTGSSGGSEGSGSSTSGLPKAPLKANQPSSDCGIIGSGGGKVTIGWKNSNSMSYYVAYAFTEKNGTYSLVKNSNHLSATAEKYVFEGLSNDKYTVQIVGYNNRGEAFEVFAPISFDNAASSDIVVGNGNPASPGGLGGAVSGQVNNITTYITEEGITQVQDVYETVNNTRTTTTGPSVTEQILWVVLWIIGGVMLLASGFLTFLLFKKPKKLA